jgi:hypothetical protein
MRRLDQLQSWGLIYRQGRHYYMDEKALNSLLGMRSYRQIRRLLASATHKPMKKVSNRLPKGSLAGA